jgi:hypothetical protein
VRIAAMLVLALGWLLLVTGCISRPSKGTDSLSSEGAPPVMVPARVVANFFLVEATQVDGSTRRFMIDTGSTANLVSFELAQALGRREGARGPVRIRGAHGGELQLEPVTMRRVQLGGAAFERVSALIYDFTELSAHLGLRIDGLLGFPFFRERLLTLDYRRSQLVLAPSTQRPPTAPPGATLAFNNEQRVPLIPVQMGNESFFALIDSGSDAGLHLNPTGLHPRFIFGPRSGTIVSSLGNEHQQFVGRLAQDVLIGSHVVREPIVDITDQLSSLGGELLRHFTITFDQQRNEVTFARAAGGPVEMEPRRSNGMALARSPNYWRVLGVIPDTPTAEIGVQPGDLIVRINGEPVERWNQERYATLMAAAVSITFTFISGTQEYDVEIPVIELVP